MEVIPTLNRIPWELTWVSRITKINLIMKNIKILLIGALMLSLTSCEGFLEEDPKGLMAPEGFFRTPSDVEAAVMGAYAEWVTNQIEKSYFVALMLRSDMVDIGDQNTLGDRITVNNFTMDPNNSLMWETWYRLYQSISGANTAIKAAREINAETRIKLELEAKARFIRGFNYYHLVRAFGEVPLLLDPIESEEAMSAIRRTAEAEIYDVIIEDLLFAKENLPMTGSLSSRNIGTKGSASTVLSEVYLTLNRFEDSAIEARYVINNADGFNYALESNYQNLYNADLAGSLRESILTYQLKNDLFSGQYNQSDGMINLSRVRDLAPRSLSVLVPSLKVYDTWDARDYRRKVSFEDSVMVNGERRALTSLNIRVPRPHIAKYFRFPGPQDSGDDRSSDHHYNLFRYADVLLIAAEAIAEYQGATPEAIGYVNQIRKRARFNGVEETEFPYDVQNGISREEFIQLVREERRLEFAFEFKRWYDIKRWGVLESSFSGQDALETHQINPNRDYLFPIPQREIDVTGFIQNDGY
jgi:hypothetical protein